MSGTLRPLTEILEAGEDERTEFKKSFGLPVVESLCAFANTRGGSVFVGVQDDGTVVGVNTGKETIQNWTNQIKLSTAPVLIPDIREYSHPKGTVVELVVDEYPVKPVSCKGRYYRRVKNANHQLTVREVVDWHTRTVTTSWDYFPDPNHTVADISLEKVASFVDLMSENRRHPVQDSALEVLRKFELLREQGITLGCYLLFMEDESVLSTIEMGRFQTETVIKDTARVKTDLFSEIEAVMDFVTKHINKNVIISGEPRHTERWEYPLDAIREIVVNAVVHRDYSRTSDTVIKVFDNRIEFYNPGKLPSDLSVEKFLSNEYTSVLRNKQIASVFKEAGIVEKYGSGIRRVREAFLNAGGKEPLFEELGEGFRVTVYSLDLNER